MSQRFINFINDANALEPRVGSINIGQIQYIQQLLVRNPHIKHVLETGFHTGISAATFMDVREDIQVTSFDIFWFDYTRKAKLILDKYYPDRNLLIAGNSLGSLPTYFRQIRQEIDLVFIDGGHEWPTPYYDLQVILANMKEGTIVLIDDYCEAHGRQGVIRAVDEIVKKGLLKDIQLIQFADRGMVHAIRSSINYTPEVTKEERHKLLEDISSHYE